MHEDSADILDQVFAASGPEVIFETFGDEMVIANLESGFFYSIEGSGADIWNALVGGHTARRFAAASNAVAENAHAKIARFIADLRSEGLLVEAVARSNPAPLTVAPFTNPSMKKFDDLQGLLLVDPIHEASPAGWPFVQGVDASRG